MKTTHIGFLSIALCIILSISVFAARDVSFENNLAADLRELGLFSGVSADDFDLDRAPTRTEVLVMLIRVLGEEDEALSGTWSHPFNDVAPWADPYVGYAYTNGLTQGVSSTRFGTGNAGVATYLTFMLRALGYSDANNKDFPWDNPYVLAKSVGIMPDFIDTENFWRADIVSISYAALGAKLKGSNQTLAEKLMAAGTFTVEAYREYYHPTKLNNPPQRKPDKEEVTGILTSAEIYEKCSPAVFYIEIYNASGTAIGSGSGFFINGSGMAVTNHHVIDEAASAKAILAGSGETYNISGVYDYDENGDWAIIQVAGSDKVFPTLSISTAPVAGGENIFTIGSPQGLQNSISTGVVSNPSRIIEGTEYIQITAPISPGSSGGALINELGQVIGITSATLESGQSLNFARPISCITNANKSILTPLPLKQKPAGATTQPTWSKLKDNLKTYGEYSHEYSTYSFSKTVDSDYYQVAYDLEYDEISIGGILTLDGGKVYIYISIKETGNPYVLCSVELENGYEVNGGGYINAATFNESTTVSLSEYDGTENDKPYFLSILSGAATGFLLGYDEYFVGSYNSVTAADLGFKAIR